MGAYKYCEHCEGPLPGPWGLSTREILEALFGADDCELGCRNCDTSNEYYKDDLLDELADRIDNKE